MERVNILARFGGAELKRGGIAGGRDEAKLVAAGSAGGEAVAKDSAGLALVIPRDGG